MNRRRFFLLTALLSAVVLTAGDDGRRALTMYRQALQSPSAGERIGALAESLTRRYSDAAHVLLLETLEAAPDQTENAAAALLEWQTRTGAAPDLRLAGFVVFDLRPHIPAGRIAADQWIRYLEAALRPWSGDVRPAPAQYNAVMGLRGQYCTDQITCLRFDDALATLDQQEKWIGEPAEAVRRMRVVTYHLAAAHFPDDAKWQKRKQQELQAVMAWEPAADAAPEKLATCGDWYLQVDAVSEAVRIAEKLQRQYPDRPEGVLLRIRTLTARGDYTALDELAASLPPDHPAALTCRLEAATRGDRLQEAIDILQHELPKAVEWRIHLLLCAGKYDDAAGEIAALGSPMREYWLTRLAICRGTTGEHLRFLRQRETELEGSRRHAIFSMMLEIAESTRDRALFEECRQKIQAAGLLKDPEFANSVGYVAAELDLDLPEAQKLIGYALSVDPFNAAWLDSMAWVRFKQGDHAGARLWIRRSLACGGRSEPTLEEHAGDICAALGDRDAARQHYQNALAIRPRKLHFNEAAVRAKLAKLI